MPTLGFNDPCVYQYAIYCGMMLQERGEYRGVLIY